MSTFDKVLHTLGVIAAGVVTVAASAPTLGIPAIVVAISGVVAYAAGAAATPIKKTPPPAIIILLGLALLGASCAHSTFERCVRDRLAAQVDAKVQGAVACHGEQSCLISQGITDVLDVNNVVSICKAETADGGQ